MQDALQGNLEGLQLIEAELLPLISEDLPVADFSRVGLRPGAEAPSEPVLYRPRDGWRIILRAHQLRAASLLAWSKNEPFDRNAGVSALVLPAIREAQANLGSD